MLSLYIDQIVLSMMVTNTHQCIPLSWWFHSTLTLPCPPAGVRQPAGLLAGGIYRDNPYNHIRNNGRGTRRRRGGWFFCTFAFSDINEDQAFDFGAKKKKKKAPKTDAVEQVEELTEKVETIALEEEDPAAMFADLKKKVCDFNFGSLFLEEETCRNC